MISMSPEIVELYKKRQKAIFAEIEQRLIEIGNFEAEISRLRNEAAIINWQLTIWEEQNSII